ncbi:Glycogen synthase kinase-3 [Tritrichomonas foetus]|uniref:Glycogen synthase kinase-3 n=1 Tax=Tritrichomonas foetus TaxID=1144522 RepID=A0A1J4JZ88_9EUKA|nr:Glycogen synthase kinase-3 [Tritrichomonas foetus]|eukprot:OHT04473.1 Glycogen synthase kinase-3 [Tritrichomonas foetus]
MSAIRNSILQINGGITIRKRRISQPPSKAENTIQRRNILYKPIKYIGKGAFGVVYITRSPENNELVAVKKILHDPKYKNRELDIMKNLKHPNCVSLKTAFKTRGDKPNEIYYNIVMDFMPCSLNQYNLSFRVSNMKPPRILVKLFSFQLFSGLAYLHHIGITHRDIKPQNILIDPDSGVLKIGDFGSAKKLGNNENSVTYIASRYYRSPELLFECNNYSNKIDIWAAGCVIAEMIKPGSPIFHGGNSNEQIFELFNILGPPTEEDMESFEHLRDLDINLYYDYLDYMANIKKIELIYQKSDPSKISINANDLLNEKLDEIRSNAKGIESCLAAKSDLLDLVYLLRKIFVYNPTKRISAIECLRHSCFDELFESCARLPNDKILPPLDRFPNFDFGIQHERAAS